MADAGGQASFRNSAVRDPSLNGLMRQPCRLLSSEPWSLERFQVYSPARSRHGYLISHSTTYFEKIGPTRFCR